MNLVAQQFSFSVVGAGVVGLTVGSALKAKGIPLQIFEKRRDKISYPNFRIHIDEVGRSSLKSILPQPIFDKILHSSFETHNKNTYLSAKNLSVLRTVKDNNTINVISSSRYSNILLEDNLPVNWGANYIGFRPTPNVNNELTMMFEGNDPIDSNFLIACDGVNSPIRKQVLSQDTSVDSGFRYIEGKIKGSFSSSSLPDLLVNPITVIESNGYALTAYQLEEGDGEMCTHWRLSFLDQSYQGILEKKSVRKEREILKEYCLDSTKGWNSAIIDMINNTDPQNIRSLEKYVYQYPVRKKRNKKVLYFGDSCYGVAPFNYGGFNSYLGDINKFIVYLSNANDQGAMQKLVNEMIPVGKVSGSSFAVRYEKEMETIHATNFLRVALRNYNWRTGRKLFGFY